MPPTRLPSFFAHPSRTILTPQHASPRNPPTTQHFRTALLFSTSTPRRSGKKYAYARSPKVRALEEQKKLEDSHKPSEEERAVEEEIMSWSEEQKKQVVRLKAQGLSDRAIFDTVRTKKKGFWAQLWKKMKSFGFTI